MKEIELTQGKVALVDDEDYEALMQYKWFALYDGWNWYAKRGRRKSDGLGPCKIWMHRIILKLADGERADHINRNGLDNQRSNLRVATRSQNAANSKRRSTNTSGYKRVSFRKDHGKWQAHIGSRRIGYFNTPLEAAIAYNEAALEFYGEFARINKL